MDEIQRRALERGVGIYRRLEAVKDDPDWQRFCHFMDLWEKRTDSIDPLVAEQIEAELQIHEEIEQAEAKQAEGRVMGTPNVGAQLVE